MILYDDDDHDDCDDGGGCADDDLPGVWLPIFASDQYSGYVPLDMWFMCLWSL